MGTFHQDKGELHGITVVVRTNGPQTWVGRCDIATPEGVVLFGADRHVEGEDELTLADWMQRVAQVGCFPRHDRVVVPGAEILELKPLAEY